MDLKLLQEHERLYLLLEEMGETLQIAGKILRHGYDNHHPGDTTPNRVLLEKGVGGVVFAIRLAVEKGDLSWEEIDKYSKIKAERVGQYLYYNTVPDSLKGNG